MSHSMSALESADVVYVLRMQRERMAPGASYVPSLTEYAAVWGVTPARLRPSQLVMHPGPINRGVEIAPEVADSAASRIVDQVRAGLVVRMAVLYDLLAGPGKADAEAALRIVAPDVRLGGRAGGGLMERLVLRTRSPGRPPDRRRPRRRPGIGSRRRRARRPHPRGSDRRDRAEPRPHRSRDDRGRRPRALARPRRSARPPAHPRRRGRGGHRVGHPRGGGRRVHRDPRDAEHEPRRRHSGRPRGPGRAGPARGVRADRVHGRDHRRPGGRAHCRDVRAGRGRRRRVLGRRPPRRAGGDPPPGLPVRLGHGAAARAPRGGPVALGRRPDARGRGVGRARARGLPVDRRERHGRPRPGDRPLRGRARPHLPRLGGRVGGRDPARARAWSGRHRRGDRRTISVSPTSTFAASTPPGPR